MQRRGKAPHRDEIMGEAGNGFGRPILAGEMHQPAPTVGRPWTRSGGERSLRTAHGQRQLRTEAVCADGVKAPPYTGQ